MSLADLDSSTIYDDCRPIVSHCSDRTARHILVTPGYRYIAIVMLGLGKRYFQVFVKSLTLDSSYQGDLSSQIVRGTDRLLRLAIQNRVRTASIESAIMSRLGSLSSNVIHKHSLPWQEHTDE